NKDNIFQADQGDAFDYDDEAPIAQTMFMANLSSVGPVYDEAVSSYDSDILSEVHDYDNCLDNLNPNHVEHEMPNDVQPFDVVDSDIDYTSNSNIISYEQSLETYAWDFMLSLSMLAKYEHAVMILTLLEPDISIFIFIRTSPIAQTMFMANLSSVGPVYDEAVSSYDSDILSEVHDYDNCLDNLNPNHVEHEMPNDVQPFDVVDSDIDYTSNSNIISYEQYV
nr:hypothetical protein [Tanacetum cinerariifolium]